MDEKHLELNEKSSIEDIRAYIKQIEQKNPVAAKKVQGKKIHDEKDYTKIEEFDKLKTKVLKYIMYKKRTEKEVRTKFSSSDINKDTLEDVIENLKENGYINDESYIQRAINEFLAINTLSLKEIRNKLYAKGISSSIIDLYFCEHDEELQEYELMCAKKIALKKQSQMEQNDIEAFLYRKGYSKESIKFALM